MYYSVIQSSLNWGFLVTSLFIHYSAVLRTLRCLCGLRAVVSVQSGVASPIPIPGPPEDVSKLGHLLYARLLPFASEKPALVSTSPANSNQVLFQCAVVSVLYRITSLGQAPGSSIAKTYAGDEEEFRSKFGMIPEQAEKHAIHGGGVPIHVRGVEGIVAVVVVSGLKQHEDHGVILDVISNNWE
ncbi:hypothetical protein F4779DRAFT_627696 [Xylariaceae sp. FL0662B]|nr:hypothetical protein F4779DRAFT_627696 [Xylariaceae sp. FL0662B]